MTQAEPFDEQNSRSLVLHQIEPVWAADSQTLILGTMPSPASREAGFFYMHPQTRFWGVLPAVLGVPLTRPNNANDREAAIKERKAFLLRHHLALWDVLSSCKIHGADDASIKNAVPNDFMPLFSQSEIRRVFCTGKTAFALWQRLCASRYEKQFALKAACLPSTSPANARWSVAALVEEYRTMMRPNQLQSSS
ncbi:MAG: DNA-deoxyinosine glycosylase [Treponema sp.]|nr:DNA-deoxyinosine glycosylase [Treponema sp.]